MGSNIEKKSLKKTESNILGALKTILEKYNNLLYKNKIYKKIFLHYMSTNTIFANYIRKGEIVIKGVRTFSRNSKKELFRLENGG